jgi:hypothetical protein
MVQRKTKDGKKSTWDRANAQPRIYPPTLSYTGREDEQSSGFKAAIESAGMGYSKPTTEGGSPNE